MAAMRRADEVVSRSAVLAAALTVFSRAPQNQLFGQTTSAPAIGPAQPGSETPVRNIVPIKLRMRRPAPIDPSRLLDLSREDVQALIGDPLRMRRDMPALVWAYRSAVCRNETDFYPEVSDRVLRALTYRTEALRARGVSGAACLAKAEDAQSTNK